MNSNQISAIKDLEKAGRDVGWVVGKDGTPDQITGRGVRDLVRILGRRGLL